MRRFRARCGDDASNRGDVHALNARGAHRGVHDYAHDYAHSVLNPFSN